MRITLDTNVLVSGTFWKGDSNKIIDLIEQRKVELILSEEIIEEYKEVIARDEIIDKIKNKELILNQVVLRIINDSKVVSPFQKVDIIKEDPEDNIILEAAIEGNSEYIISQDKHLLNLKECKGIKIISPEEFLKVVSP